MHDNTRRESNNMMLFPPMPEFDSIKYYKQALQVSVHHFYIIDEIGDVPPFLDMINVLKTAEQHDTIFIYLNTPGGNLYTAIQIISAIRQSNATVVTCIEGMVASAGTIIFLAGHKHVVNANCSFMIHNYSHGVWGKGNEVNLRVKHSEQYFKKLAVDMYGKFLTTDEIEELINGKDFWMESEEVMERLGSENSAESVNALMDSLSSDVTPADADADSEEEAILEALIIAATAALAAEGISADTEEKTEIAKPVVPKAKRKPKPKKT